MPLPTRPSPHNESVREELKTHEPGVGRYVVIWIILLICTFATFGVSKLPLSPNGHLAAAMAISLVKATLVALTSPDSGDLQPGANAGEGKDVRIGKT